MGAGLLRQAHIPFHLHLLRNGGSAGQAQLLCHRPGVDGVVLYQILVFAVVQEGQAHSLGRLHGLAEELLILDGHPVVGQGRSARLLQSGKVCQLRPAQALCHGAHGQVSHAGGGGLLHHQAHQLWTVGDGLGVGHGHQGGHSTAGSCGAARSHRLLVRKARLPQMDVHIH